MSTKSTKFITADGFKEIETEILKRKRKTFSAKNKRLLKKINNNFHTITAPIKKAGTKTGYFIYNVKRKLAKNYSLKVIVDKTYPNRKKQLAPKTAFSYIGPALAVCMLFATIGFLSNLQFGLSVKDGNSVATVENEAVYQKAREKVNSALSATTAATQYTAPEMELKILNFSQEEAEPTQVIYKKILETTTDVDTGYGVYVDGTYMGAVADQNQLSEQLDQVLLTKRAKFDMETTTEFLNTIEMEEGIYPVESILSIDEIIQLCLPALSIEMQTDMVYNYELDFETEYTYDDTEYEDYKKVTQKGEKGEQTVIYRLVYIDGEQTDAVLTSDSITKEPVTEKITIGTKSKGIGTGDFMWPVPYTKSITSYYGSRWGTFHYGIDISSSGVDGQDIVASDTGKVTFAGYDNSGYGYYVIIDHGNGYETMYAHCSDIYISEGASVKQGDVIAAVGSTGDSTGSHLHFEVIKNGEKLDPVNYVSE